MSFYVIRRCKICGKNMDVKLFVYSNDFKPIICSPECEVEMMMRRGALDIGDHPVLLKRVYT